MTVTIPREVRLIIFGSYVMHQTVTQLIYICCPGLSYHKTCNFVYCLIHSGESKLCYAVSVLINVQSLVATYKTIFKKNIVTSNQNIQTFGNTFVVKSPQ
jgi:hypothetical protein